MGAIAGARGARRARLSPGETRRSGPRATLRGGSQCCRRSERNRRRRLQARGAASRGERHAGAAGSAGEMNGGEQTRCGFIAVIGAPNAGKSTLVNTLVGSKVTIVTPKVQTTRMRIRGVAIRGNTQIVFVDTPGIFKPRRRLDRAMVNAAWAGAGEADAIILIVDAADLATNPDGYAARDTAAIIEKLRESKRKSALVLNKVDAMKREHLLPIAEQLNK